MTFNIQISAIRIHANTLIYNTFIIWHKMQDNVQNQIQQCSNWIYSKNNTQILWFEEKLSFVWTQQIQCSDFYLPATLAKSFYINQNIKPLNAWNEIHNIN